ncbi:hypothetical protein M2171_000236 [Bradyrhizobium japonicum USDA 38]|uniref:hypothetical protein n=1 Tax=Bradyrhizobium japonicum TaxID=375 RepID=UPI000485A80C|nr:hypothetical protein [Bradyrhizobium japonicum]MCS3891103.1 hypothetical protein [Bradyrhizobium japonicum USDA 38]MCS3943619.1 hypothetical protein [Bradyrhizobium japonicum]
MNIYIACALTHVPRSLFDEHVAFIHELAQRLQENDAAAAVKYALINSDPQLATKPETERARLCYLWDRSMVEEADLVIAEASFPSTGLGIELQLAESNGTPIILCFRDFGTNKVAPASYANPDRSHHELQVGQGLVTLMALGIPTIFRTIQYYGQDDGIKRIVDATNSLRQ